MYIVLVILLGVGVYGRPNVRFQGPIRGLGQTLLQLSSSRGSVCQGKGQLSDRLLGYVKAKDANGDGVYTGNEMAAYISKLDADKDGVLSEQEGINYFVHKMNFSEEFYKLQYLADTPQVHHSKLNDTKVILATELIHATLGSLVELCEGNQTLYLTNCDCLQLTHSCVSRTELKSTIPCAEFLSRQFQSTKSC
ncbi:uncharacterized protein LOC131931229 [Physella acuta]|uniref:uncharacterized protein LOC131931229 n=1 Tax=Physella acuta TaxID=109671 RepID=UPI0027DBD2EE|nr:uncharacterized protein LOC131931229 [Physella acuta]